MPMIPFGSSTLFKAEIETPNGVIYTPDQVLATDISNVAPSEWRNKFNFYNIGKIVKQTIRSEMKVGIIKKKENIRGVKKLSFKITFPEYVYIIDHGPKTEWTKKNYSIVIDDKLKFKPVEEIPVELLSISFQWKWEPKIGKVISTSAGQHSAKFEFNATDNEYLDGERSLYFMFRIEKGINLPPPSFPISIRDIKVKYDTIFARDIEDEKNEEYKTECILPNLSF